ncbi:hypothetical protein EBB07_18655 [Paenibacillaceae bacterium]|nr:hypothetical protein EBB07_18655 [Paenibacillaceae bacterium]
MPEQEASGRQGLLEQEAVGRQGLPEREASGRQGLPEQEASNKQPAKVASPRRSTIDSSPPSIIGWRFFSVSEPTA